MILILSYVVILTYLIRARLLIFKRVAMRKSFYVDMGPDIKKEKDNSSVDGESSVHYFLATTMIVWSVGKFYSLRRRWRFPTDQMQAVRLECEPRSIFERSRRSKRGTDKVQDVVDS